MNPWNECKNILCIRADNMGDLLMSSPAIRALKETFNCRITLLTSAMGNLIAPFISEIDETIVADLPWVKTKKSMDNSRLMLLIEKLRCYHFDAAIIFTVYSQNPLPSAMLAFMAGIPKRLAYCRENPYSLLTDWMEEKEPYHFIQHQVIRDLHLVNKVDAITGDDRIKIFFSQNAEKKALEKITHAGADLTKSWLIIHPGVSESKREYPKEKWIEACRLLRDQLKFQIIITGSGLEKSLCTEIKHASGKGVYSMAGILSVEEFIALINKAPLTISVNTGTVHIAAATQTPVIVLYALTNPQHTPWKVPSSVLFYSVGEKRSSKNEVVNYVTTQLLEPNLNVPSPFLILKKARELLYREIALG